MPWRQIMTYRKFCCKNFKKGSFDWKLRGILPFLIVEIDRRENPPTPIISPNIPDQRFDMAILFNVVERPGNYVFEDDNPPPIALRTRVVSYALGAYKVFIESFVVEASKRALSIGN
jgi:hypothetical protein